MSDYDWYEEYIEEPIRDIVRYLRNNGVNTECSCGDDMYVQCQYILDGSLERIHSLVYNYLHEKGVPINFTIEVHHRVLEGHSYNAIEIRLPTREKKFLTSEPKGGK